MNHPFPYDNLKFRKAFLELEQLSALNDYKKICAVYSLLKNTLNQVDYEYMIWQEWKEGFARFIENEIRKSLGLDTNVQELREPFSRVSFYNSGIKHIESILNHADDNLTLHDLFVHLISEALT
ncbi:MAG: hypothetical protein JXQ23_05070 [Clostridia bacterium]|nr:hypothetical protein [Clostridia bacterium]